ncbi:MAG TPA: DUF1810 domain-containing protein [Kineosporiaceae bacterium]|nr:DUF1810 domain-containing protein [Kineosporiaceae bacterium]
MADEYRLERFVIAQDEADTYPRAVQELQAARKQSHWMWFVFPQLAGLGRSPMAQLYAISGLPEAQAYLQHPVLGARLLECANLLTTIGGTSAEEIFGSIDAQKLQSSMTLFARAAPQEKVFQAVLDRYFDGKLDEETTSRL